MRAANHVRLLGSTSTDFQNKWFPTSQLPSSLFCTTYSWYALTARSPASPAKEEHAKMAEQSTAGLSSPTAEQRRIALESLHQSEKDLAKECGYRLRHSTSAHLLQTRPGQLPVPAGVASAHAEGQTREQPPRKPVRVPHSRRGGRRNCESRNVAANTSKPLARIRRTSVSAGRNPWDLCVQMDMAEAFDALALSGPRQRVSRSTRHGRSTPKMRRCLTVRSPGSSRNAGTSRRRWCFGNSFAIPIRPTDVEAARKAKDLAANATIQKGGVRGSRSRHEGITGRRPDRVAGSR